MKNRKWENRVEKFIASKEECSRRRLEFVSNKRRKNIKISIQILFEEFDQIGNATVYRIRVDSQRETQNSRETRNI